MDTQYQIFSDSYTLHKLYLESITNMLTGWNQKQSATKLFIPS